MEKHQNPDGTYDGAGVLAELSGMERTEVVAMWEKVRQNQAKLSACPYHEFLPVLPLATRSRFRCRHCDGEVDSSAYIWHERGRNSRPDQKVDR